MLLESKAHKGRFSHNAGKHHLQRHAIVMIFTMLCTISSVIATDQNLHDTAREYQLLSDDAKRVKGEDLDLIKISSSSIHGRGTAITRPVKKGTPIGILIYEVSKDTGNYVQLENGYWHARGFITDGGKIDDAHTTVTDALQRCSEMERCEGITFQDPQKSFSDPMKEIPAITVDVEFKDKTHFSPDNENLWQSYLKQPDDHEGVYYPLGCNSFLSNPPPASLDSKLMLPCWPRFVNHSCNPTTKLVKAPVENGFVLPGIPWKDVLFSYQVVSLRDMEADEEFTLNYEDFPSYLSRSVDGAECETSHDEL